MLFDFLSANLLVLMRRLSLKQHRDVLSGNE